MNENHTKYLFACIFVIAIFSMTILPCTYGPPYATVCEKYADADAIVVGKILDVRSGGNGQLVKLNIKRLYKGKINGTITLDQPLSTCDWDFVDENGEEFLLYLRKNKGQPSFHAIGTGYGGKFEQQNDDLYWLNGLPGSLKRTRISGMIQLYEHEPFDFLNFLSDVPIVISNGKLNYKIRSDKNGVYEVWDIPRGKYTVTPSFENIYKLRFPLSRGNIEFKPISKVEVDTDDFHILIGKEKCGGADFVLNKRND